MFYGLPLAIAALPIQLPRVIPFALSIADCCLLIIYFHQPSSINCIYYCNIIVHGVSNSDSNGKLCQSHSHLSNFTGQSSRKTLSDTPSLTCECLAFPPILRTLSLILAPSV
ncbi:hypothetical protein BJX63DRAFT_8467 [Aspergillus granulosus]|uniref:Uncharacterized protein n=1 Tax=Aspergillus granulosus TaxID=176169 RepID=A0ABR4HV59_9EURO